jgi:hypothetical protein
LTANLQAFRIRAPKGGRALQHRASDTCRAACCPCGGDLGLVRVGPGMGVPVPGGVRRLAHGGPGWCLGGCHGPHACTVPGAWYAGRIRWHPFPPVSPRLAPVATMGIEPLQHLGGCAAFAPVQRWSRQCGMASRGPKWPQLVSREAAMKKVRYLIRTAGVLGAAPALGLLLPATTAAAATHATATGYSGKTVSLRPGTVLAAASALPVTSVAAVTSSVPAASSAPAASSVPVPSIASPRSRTCTNDGGDSAHKGTGPNKFTAHVSYRSETHCVTRVTGLLYHSQTGLSMRIRLYNGKKLVHHTYVGGSIPTIFADETSFWSNNLAITATRACEALVYSTDRAKVAYGPVCEKVY